VVGTVGSGKTSLLKYIKERDDIAVVWEAVDIWTGVQPFVGDKRSNFVRSGVSEGGAHYQRLQSVVLHSTFRALLAPLKKATKERSPLYTDGELCSTLVSSRVGCSVIVVKSR